ncbi:hypothetical protein BDE02_06G224400 [Populus trichocarpa]|nr:hypothetical protein BDE02_06G224400 [Populus trichocarpa]
MEFGSILKLHIDPKRKDREMKSERRLGFHDGLG